MLVSSIANACASDTSLYLQIEVERFEQAATFHAGSFHVEIGGAAIIGNLDESVTLELEERRLPPR